MVKRVPKQLVSALLCLAFLVPYFLVFPAQALTYNTINIKPNMSREDCWKEAANYAHTGMSRDRIAVEIYYWSQKREQLAQATQSFYDADLYTAGLCVAGYITSLGVAFFNPPAGIATAKVVSGACTVAAAGLAPGTIIVKYNQDRADSAFQVAKLGDDSNDLVSRFYSTWYSAEGEGTPIRSALSEKKVIDISGNSNANGTKVQLWSSNGTGAQKFYILQTGDDSWCNIFKAGTFKCLDVTSGKTEKGVKIQLWSYNGSKAQDWKLENAGGEYVYLKNRWGYYMDVCGGDSADGTQIWTWTSNKTNAQKWKIA